MSYTFADSFNGYSFSFSLLYNSAAGVTDQVLNGTLEDGTCVPFGNQFVLQPFGNSYAAYNRSNQTGRNNSAISARAISKLFAAAFTPATVAFTCTFDAQGQNIVPKVTIQYKSPCTKDVSGNPCMAFAAPVVFTFSGANAKTLAQSDSQYIEVPYWTAEQVTSDTSGSCYPQFARVKVHLESDYFWQSIFPKLITYSTQYESIFGKTDPNTVGQNAGTPFDDSQTYNAFPSFYLRVVQDATFLSKLTRPYAITNLGLLGGSLNILTKYTISTTSYCAASPVGACTFAQFSPLSSVITTQNTNNIGLFVFTNLHLTIVSQQFLISSQKSTTDITIGSFPTTEGSTVITDLTNVIKSGDVLIFQSEGKGGVLEDGSYMSFTQKTTKDTSGNIIKVPEKAPSMDTAPSPAQYFLWQIVKVDQFANLIGSVGDPIGYGDYVSFYAYRCTDYIGKDPAYPISQCGWLSSTKCSLANNCYPSISATRSLCELWKIEDVSLGHGPQVKTGVYLGIKSASTVSSSCKGTSGWYLINNSSTYTIDGKTFHPPTLSAQLDLANPNSYWKLNRVLLSQQLPS